MLKDRVSLEARVAGCRFLFLSLVLFTTGMPVHSLFAEIDVPGVALPGHQGSDQGTPVGDHVAAPPAEFCNLFNAAPDLQFDSLLTETQFWSPVAMPSPGIIPSGLVLSYLCDSARHQCSGVQLI